MRPIIYIANVAVRFSDLDPYGHVNSTHYLDYVISSRWAYAATHLGVTTRTLAEKKIGFFLTKAQMEFKRPVTGATTVTASSHVREIDGARLAVPFSLRSSDGASLHCQGDLDFLVIDLATTKPVACPDWVRALFFQPAEAESSGAHHASAT